MKRIKIIYSIAAIIFLTAYITVSAQNQTLLVEPPFWWINMHDQDLQLLVYGKDISKTEVSINKPGVKLKRINQVENPDYLFLDLFIASDAREGSFTLSFHQGKKKTASYEYLLLNRKPGSDKRAGFGPEDVIYLLMPDRFANGNLDNDNAVGMLEKADRNNPDGRHGGDLLGIENKLIYLNELGITAIWINPLLENNMPRYSYHGYAITDYYKIDPRFGTNQEYVAFVEQAHQQNIKVIMDMVFNHCGTGHWWNNNLPSEDWYNQWPEFTRSNYRGGTVSDPYASEVDKEKMLRGWFDVTMADLNQQNEFLANYLIQNSIWWIEYANLDGIRMDTYPYSFKDFMAEWMNRILEEYPGFNVVAESWLPSPSQVAYWQANAQNRDGYESYVTNVFDFPMMYAMGKAFNETDNWTEGIVRLYDVLGHDFVYKDPNCLVNFTDNHDGDRFYTKINQNLKSFKLAMAFLLTTRGIPQLYYGTEILMTGQEHLGHGDIRKDFPGGWPADSMNAFVEAGRTDDQNEAFLFLSQLLNWRKNKEVIHSGQLKHFVPVNGVYVFFRYNNKESVMVILNNSSDVQLVDTGRFKECLSGFRKGKEVISGNEIHNLETLEIPAKSTLIIELE